jgi:hypothetical protein
METSFILIVLSWINKGYHYHYYYYAGKSNAAVTRADCITKSTFNLWPWKTISSSLAPWRSKVPRCQILKFTVCFTATLTLTSDLIKIAVGIFLSYKWWSNVLRCGILYSVSSLLTRLSCYVWLSHWSLTLLKPQEFEIVSIKSIKCTKMYLIDQTISYMYA